MSQRGFRRNGDIAAAIACCLSCSAGHLEGLGCGAAAVKSDVKSGTCVVQCHCTAAAAELLRCVHIAQGQSINQSINLHFLSLGLIRGVNTQ